MSKHTKAILTAITLLLVSSVSAQETPTELEKIQEEIALLETYKTNLARITLQKKLEDCEWVVLWLNSFSEAMDRTGDNASDKIQMKFAKAHYKVSVCAAELTNQTGKLTNETGMKFTLSKDWFGSGYTLKKPEGLSRVTDWKDLPE